MLNVDKCDYLFLVVGTNPFPNLISILTRLNENGIVYLLCTENNNKGYSDTKEIAEKLEKVITNKMPEVKVRGFVILSRNSIEEVVEKVENTLKNINSEINNKIVELNFTGGTKAMAAGAYHAFKQFAENNINGLINARFNLTYVDGENEKIYYEIIDSDIVKFYEEYIKELKVTKGIKIEEICEVHNINLIDNYEEEPFDPILGSKIFNLFLKEPIEENYSIAIDYLEHVYTRYNKLKASKWDDFKDIEYSNPKNPFPEIKILDDFCDTNKKVNRKNKKRYLEAICGKWFEDYVFELLIKIKEKGYLTDVVGSGTRKDEREFEVDLLAYRPFKFFGFSITSEEQLEMDKDKLFEIKERAVQLGGSEAGICFICLYKKSRDLEKLIKNVWGEGVDKNILVIGVDRFYDIENLIENWVKAGGDSGVKEY